MDDAKRDRVRGCAVGAAVGDALGMPLEFGPRHANGDLVREMRPGRLPAGAFTDDTEMALALAESLLVCCPLNPVNLARRFAAWYEASPADIGRQTRLVLCRVAAGQEWQQAVEEVRQEWPDSAGNGSVMRCWPVALAYCGAACEQAFRRMLADSMLQSEVTHPHPECMAGSAFVNAAIWHLLDGAPPRQAVAQALSDVDMPAGLRATIEAAPGRDERCLANSGWVRHTLESAVWGLLTTSDFEEAVVRVANLGNDADSAAAVVGMLAGATYGLAGIPERWTEVLHGEWPLRSGYDWQMDDLIELADELADLSVAYNLE